MVKQVEGKVYKLASHHNALVQRVAQLETRSPSPGRTSLAGTSTTGMRAGTSGVVAPSWGFASVHSSAIAGWRPQVVEVRGFCAFGKRQSEGIDRPGAESLRDDLVKNSPTSLREKLGPPQLMGLRSNIVKFPTDPDYLQEVQEIMNDLLRSGMVNWGASAKLYAVPQREPRLQHRFSTLGRLKDWAQHNELVSKRCPDAIWDPTSEIVVNSESGERRPLVTVTPNSELQWNEEMMKLIGFPNVGEAVVSFSSHRRNR